MIIQTWSRRSCRSNTEYAAQRHLTPLSGRSWPDSRARTVPISPSSQTMISSASAIADNRLRASGWHFCRMAQSGRANWARWRPEVALGVVRCRPSRPSPSSRLPMEDEYIGFHARVVQHECDHLDGILYPDRIENRRMFGFIEELQAAGLLGRAVLPTE